MKRIKKEKKEKKRKVRYLHKQKIELNHRGNGKVLTNVVVLDDTTYNTKNTTVKIVVKLRSYYLDIACFTGCCFGKHHV